MAARRAGMKPAMTRRQFCAAALLPTLRAAAIAAPPATPGTWVEASDKSLDQWIAFQRRLSIGHLARNIAPAGIIERQVETIHAAPERYAELLRESALPGAKVRIEGGLVRQTILAKPGSVAAAAFGRPGEPDYFFHWIRDSALVMGEIAALYAASPPPDARVHERCLDEFVKFSAALQRSGSTEGLGEVRFNLDGSADFLQWSRPQYDGPGLRALTLMRYEHLRSEPLPPEDARALGEVLRGDLDYIAENWREPGFDLWEEYKGHDFHTRVVQMAALHAGAARATAKGESGRASRYSAAEAELRAVLEEHWLEAKGYYGFTVGPTRYWNGKEQVKPGENFDSAVILAAVHGRLDAGRYSLLDDRVLGTAAKAEDLAVQLYPINSRDPRDRPHQGVLYGRYAGDAYFGGNPFVFITLSFAEAYYRIAAMMARRASLEVTALNREFLARALARAGGPPAGGPRATQLGTLVRFDAPEGRALLKGLVSRGDDIVAAVRHLTPASGELPEQFDRESGGAVSCPNLSWSHSAFLAATSARASTREPMQGAKVV